MGRVDVPDREDALASADVVITVTGARDVVTARDLALLQDDVVLANAGHFPAEIDVGGAHQRSNIERVAPASEGITSLHLRDGRRIHVLGDGHMMNLAGPRPRVGQRASIRGEGDEARRVLVLLRLGLADVRLTVRFAVRDPEELDSPRRSRRLLCPRPGLDRRG